MVDALRRTHRMLQPPRGVLVDLHPMSARAAVEVGSRIIGHVKADDAPQRHGAATEALLTAVGEGLFTVERTLEFTFFTYGDSIEELSEYVAENWRNARIDDDTIRRTRETLRDAGNAQPCIRERVLVTKMRPADFPARE